MKKHYIILTLIFFVLAFALLTPWVCRFVRSGPDETITYYATQRWLGFVTSFVYGHIFNPFIFLLSLVALLWSFVGIFCRKGIRFIGALSIFDGLIMLFLTYDKTIMGYGVAVGFLLVGLYALLIPRFYRKSHP